MTLPLLEGPAIHSQAPLLLNNLIDHPPLSAAVQNAARDTATADEDGHQNEQEANDKEGHHDTNDNGFQVSPCIYGCVYVIEGSAL